MSMKIITLIFCGGDFNIDMLGDSALRFYFNVTVYTNACAHVITFPTRVTQQSATLLDTFITNVELSMIKSGVVCCDLSDHTGIFLCALKQTCKRPL